MRASARTTTRRSSSPCATKRTPSPRRRRPAADGSQRAARTACRFAVKDNIDVEGTADHRGVPGLRLSSRQQDATCVARLRRAGAIVIGKTNLDQFATGLTGTRTPYGVAAQSPSKRALIPGGSSAGSAVAVAAGLVPLALGTDTAGSGRVPAALNNIVGLKPSLGLVLHPRRSFPPAARSTASRCSRSPVDDALCGARRDGGSGSCRSLFARAAARRARPDARRASGLGCRRRATACSSATRRRTPAYEAGARASCAARGQDRRDRHRSRSTKPRACFTKGRGWRSATSRRAR